MTGQRRTRSPLRLTGMWPSLSLSSMPGCSHAPHACTWSSILCIKHMHGRFGLSRQAQKHALQQHMPSALLLRPAAAQRLTDHCPIIRTPCPLPRRLLLACKDNCIGGEVSTMPSHQSISPPEQVAQVAAWGGAIELLLRRDGPLQVYDVALLLRYHPDYLACLPRQHHIPCT